MKRSFRYEGRGNKPSFTIDTSLTDSEAINLLTNGAGIQPGTEAESFEEKCAFEIHKMTYNFLFHPNMVAWGFKIAERKK